MKIRTKIILFILLTILITTLFVTFSTYTTVLKEETEWEYTELERNVDLTKTILQDKYYEAFNRKILNAFFIKNDIIEQSKVLRSTILGTRSEALKDDPNYKVILNNLLRNCESIGLNFLVYENNKVIGTEQSLDLLDAKDKNDIELSAILNFSTPYEGSSHIFYHDDDKYLTYISLSNTKKNQKLVVLKKINSLIEETEKSHILDIIDISGFIKKMSAYNEHSIFIIDKDDKILQSNLDISLYEETSIDPWLKNSLLEIKNDTRYLNNEKSCYVKDDLYICIDFFKPLNLHIVAIKKESQIMEYPKQLSLSVSKYVILIAIIGIICAIFFSRKITNSINKIETKAQAIANADLNNPQILDELSKIEKDSNFEINKINEAFSTMIYSIKKNIQDILHTNNIKNRIETELRVAHDIQMGMLPNEESTPSSNKLDISSYLTPAKEVGGDFFDIIRIDDHSVGIIIGDVSDKGVPAALFMSICLSNLRRLLLTKQSITESLKILNNLICERNPNLMFVTLFLAIFDENTGSFTYGNAGHCRPLILRKKTNKVTELQGLSCPALGVTECDSYSQFEEKIENDDYLLVYTDGISEAQNCDKEFFGTNNIIQLLEKRNFNSSQELATNIINQLNEFRGNADQSDDITMINIKYSNK